MFTQADGAAPAHAGTSLVWNHREITLVGGERVAAFTAGSLEAGAPTIVLIHGMGHWSQAAWSRVAARLAPTHRIVAFDLPGFGASDKPDAAYTLAYFTSALEEVVARLAPDAFALAGHSFGGLIAANYAARNTNRVRALALIDPAGFLRTPKIVLRVAGSRPVGWLFRTIRPSRGFINRTLDQSVYDPGSVPSEDRERAFELSRDPLLTRAFSRVYSGAMQELLNMRALHARLATYTGSTVLIWGKNDRYVPIAGLAIARTVYPGAAVRALEACGHCPPQEHPDLVYDALIDAGF